MRQAAARVRGRTHTRCDDRFFFARRHAPWHIAALSDGAGSRARAFEGARIATAAVMIFMILMLGKHPYARIGGENPADNIKVGLFPYRSQGRLDEVPAGVWGFIWSHFPRKVKAAFEAVFREGETVTTGQWKSYLQEYLYLLDRDYFCADIVPLSFRSRQSTEVRCRDCGRWFQIDQNFLQSLQNEGKAPVCALCRQKIQATILLKKRRQNSSDRIKHALFNARHTSYRNM